MEQGVKHRSSHSGPSPAQPWDEGLGAEDTRQKLKNCLSHFSRSLCRRQQWIQASWTELSGRVGGVTGREPPGLEKSEFIITGAGRGETDAGEGLKLSVNTDVAKMPLSFCRADCGFEARRPESEPWPRHSLAVWPWANYAVASQKPCTLTGKIRVNSNYIFSCLIIGLSLTRL